MRMWGPGIFVFVDVATVGTYVNGCGNCEEFVRADVAAIEIHTFRSGLARAMAFFLFFFNKVEGWSKREKGQKEEEKEKDNEEEK